jgi:predicted HicB family RNase H-like nuclease
MITTNRNQFIGAHVTESVKNALRIEAKRQKISMSEFISAAVTLTLLKYGHKVVEQ